MDKYGITGTLVVLAAAFFCFTSGNTGTPVGAAETKAGKDRVFELRTYHTFPGKLPELNTRFRDHTNQLFEKHGIKIIGYWTPVDGPEAENTLIYIVAHESREAAKKAWADFGADPEWKKVREESEKNGKLVEKVESVYMNPTDYSPIR